ncbi:hypothetical protein NLJ89_g8751 [Agrocybe chaxingu]|uniref:Transmembrane protein n=1 Tax=Agrocybe chaxingu TaxID=84603 RepID=A0A9W8JS32_9AGAR|nr:hypothetical protein NLJ89_g8751 [Agrocybe chaxingu]
MSSFASTSTTPYTTDIEAQYPETPISAMTHTPHTTPSTRMLDPTDASFGYTFASSPTHESRHDRRQSLSEAPPAYAEEAGIPLPDYTIHAPEPVTLAMYLFKFGFLFPPFWLFGAFILMSPLRAPPSTSDDTPAWMPEKTEAERQQIIATIRKVELKWAKRCLYAFLILAVLVTAGCVAAWAVLHH